jgi:hypothetical protein
MLGGKITIYALLSAVAIATAFYAYYSYNQQVLLNLNSQIITLQQSVQEQVRVIEFQETRFRQQITALNNLSAANSELQAERDRLARIFSRHDLEELSRSRPGLVEGIINRGTQQVFDRLTHITTPE